MKKTQSLPPLALSLILLAAGALPLGAFTLEPMSLTLSPAGPQSIGSFRLSNEAGEKVAVKVELFARSANIAGEELDEKVEGLFSVYPSRLLLGPGEAKTFKVQWKGSAPIDRELCFRLVAEQVPVDFEPSSGSGIKIMFRYIASLYVSPPGMKPKLVLLGAQGGSDAAGRPGYLVELVNEGGRHVITVDTAFEFLAEGQTEGGIRLEGEALGSADGLNYLPGLHRRLFIPHESALPGKSYEARLSYNPEY